MSQINSDLPHTTQLKEGMFTIGSTPEGKVIGYFKFITQNKTRTQSHTELEFFMTFPQLMALSNKITNSLLRHIESTPPK